MSKKAKGNTIENSTAKILAILDKNDIDEARQISKNVKEYMRERLKKAAEEHEEKARTYESEA